MMLRLCEWLQHNSLVVMLNGSVLTASMLEIIHYVSFFWVVGATAIVDLRVMGLAARRQPAAQLAEDLFPWMWIGFVFAVLSGFLMFASDATEYLHNSVFHEKLFVVFLAMVLAIVIQRGVSKWDQLPSAPAWAKLVALVSLASWIGAILMGVNVPALTGVG